MSMRPAINRTTAHDDNRRQVNHDDPRNQDHVDPQDQGHVDPRNMGNRGRPDRDNGGTGINRGGSDPHRSPDPNNCGRRRGTSSQKRIRT